MAGSEGTMVWIPSDAKTATAQATSPGSSRLVRDLAESDAPAIIWLVDILIRDRPRLEDPVGSGIFMRVNNHQQIVAFDLGRTCHGFPENYSRNWRRYFHGFNGSHWVTGNSLLERKYGNRCVIELVSCAESPNGNFTPVGGQFL
ncbi:hypothetical protein [Arthrobacter sp. CG_A4]|uniref:hypothetical protein n=1 Tax=Arthrobacter sp. CG_A4 TaxID=3071706 RepID=UPI002E08F293|nr:hypothetical protein [Arthrobacter sp. CG_A4]